MHAVPVPSKLDNAAGQLSLISPNDAMSRVACLWLLPVLWDPCAHVPLVAPALLPAGLHSPLKQLDLSFCHLGDRSARAIAAMIEAVPLLALELEGNQVSSRALHRVLVPVCMR